MATPASLSPSEHTPEYKMSSSDREDSATDTPATSPLHENSLRVVNTDDPIEDDAKSAFDGVDMTTIEFSDPVDLAGATAALGETGALDGENTGVEQGKLNGLYHDSEDENRLGESVNNGALHSNRIDDEESYSESLHDGALNGHALDVEGCQDQTFDGALNSNLESVEVAQDTSVDHKAPNGLSGTAAPATGKRKQKLTIHLRPSKKQSKQTKPTKKPKTSEKPKRSKAGASRPARAPPAVTNGASDTLNAEAPVTTRSGRKIKATKKTQGPDILADLELEAQLNEATRSSPPWRAPEEEDFQPSSPLPVVKVPKRAPRRRPRDTPDSATIGRPSPPLSPASNEWPKSTPPAPGSGFGPFHALIEQNVYQLVNYVLAMEDVQVELPDIQDDERPEIEVPWTAKQLIHFYLICYHDRHFDLCDLVTDTWARAFLRLNKGAERNRVWRPRTWAKDREAKLPRWITECEDPQLHRDAIAFDTTLLSQLYYHTCKGDGARMLWADAMALCGYKVEHELERAAKLMIPVHPDLIFDIGCTALRLTRRRLTLKIEEAVEGAWCKRYHLHANESDCYRKKARKAWAAAKKAEEALKRGVELVDGVEVSQAKRVQFSNGQLGGEGNMSEEE